MLHSFCSGILTFDANGKENVTVIPFLSLCVCDFNMMAEASNHMEANTYKFCPSCYVSCSIFKLHVLFIVHAHLFKAHASELSDTKNWQLSVCCCGPHCKLFIFSCYPRLLSHLNETLHKTSLGEEHSTLLKWKSFSFSFFNRCFNIEIETKVNFIFKRCIDETPCFLSITLLSFKGEII